MRYLILTLSAVIILAACNKKPSVPQSQENMLRASRWKISGGSITVKLPSGLDTTLNLLDFVPSCNQDDYLVFDSGFSGAIYSGNNKCTLGDADSISFVWQLKNNGNNISFYNLFNSVFSVHDSIYAPYLDTLSAGPPVVLDTLSVTPLIIDTIYKSVYYPLASDVTSIDAAITTLDKTTLTIQYAIPAMYTDTVTYHRYHPVQRPDTFQYKVTYSAY